MQRPSRPARATTEKLKKKRDNYRDGGGGGHLPGSDVGIRAPLPFTSNGKCNEPTKKQPPIKNPNEKMVTAGIVGNVPANLKNITG